MYSFLPLFCFFFLWGLYQEDFNKTLYWVMRIKKNNGKATPFWCKMMRTLSRRPPKPHLDAGQFTPCEFYWEDYQKQHRLNARWFTPRESCWEGYKSHAFSVQDDSLHVNLVVKTHTIIPFRCNIFPSVWTLLNRLPKQHLLGVG